MIVGVVVDDARPDVQRARIDEPGRSRGAARDRERRRVQDARVDEDADARRRDGDVVADRDRRRAARARVAAGVERGHLGGGQRLRVDAHVVELAVEEVRGRARRTEERRGRRRAVV